MFRRIIDKEAPNDISALLLSERTFEVLWDSNKTHLPVSHRCEQHVCDEASGLPNTTLRPYDSLKGVTGSETVIFTVNYRRKI